MPYTAVNLLTGETRILRDIPGLLDFFSRRNTRGWTII